MCLGIPGKILETNDGEGVSRSGRVDFNGIVKDVSLAFVSDAGVGDYVIVHVGFAIARVDESEAQRVFRYLDEMHELKDLDGEVG
jgi:hydrogenase expression/formation protein HypC